uniref:Uncharacterized protein n=1 Tax=Ascaris lumbricoides TaxID=6252 RepID=A0A0M3HZA1_ASCLU
MQAQRAFYLSFNSSPNLSAVLSLLSKCERNFFLSYLLQERFSYVVLQYNPQRLFYDGIIGHGVDPWERSKQGKVDFAKSVSFIAVSNF